MQLIFKILQSLFYSSAQENLSLMNASSSKRSLSSTKRPSERNKERKEKEQQQKEESEKFSFSRPDPSQRRREEKSEEFSLSRPDPSQRRREEGSEEFSFSRPDPSQRRREEGSEAEEKKDFFEKSYLEEMKSGDPKKYSMSSQIPESETLSFRRPREIKPRANPSESEFKMFSMGENDPRIMSRHKLKHPERSEQTDEPSLLVSKFSEIFEKRKESSGESEGEEKSKSHPKPESPIQSRRTPQRSLKMSRSRARSSSIEESTRRPTFEHEDEASTMRPVSSSSSFEKTKIQQTRPGSLNPKQKMTSRRSPSPPNQLSGPTENITNELEKKFKRMREKKKEQEELEKSKEAESKMGVSFFQKPTEEAKGATAKNPIIEKNEERMKRLEQGEVRYVDSPGKEKPKIAPKPPALQNGPPPAPPAPPAVQNGPPPAPPAPPAVQNGPPPPPPAPPAPKF